MAFRAIWTHSAGGEANIQVSNSLELVSTSTRYDVETIFPKQILSFCLVTLILRYIGNMKNGITESIIFSTINIHN